MASLKSALGSGGTPIGGIIDGALDHDARFIRANGSRYPVAAYPSVSPIIASGQMQQYTEQTPIVRGSYDSITFEMQNTQCVDGNLIILGSLRGVTSQTETNVPIITVSNDDGATWQDSSLTVAYMSAITGVSTSNSWVVTDIVKSNTGVYVAAIRQSTNSDSVVWLMRSVDGGLTWSLTQKTSAHQWGTGRPRLVTNSTGKVLCTFYISANPIVYASYDGGLSWVSASSGDRGIENVETDGTNLFFVSDNVKTTLCWIAWPASGTIVASSFTAVATKFPTTKNRLKKISNRYVAWNGDAINAVMNIASSTTLTGTYTDTALTTFANGNLHDVSSIGSTVFFLCTSSGSASDIFYAADSAAITTATRRTASSLVPASDGRHNFKTTPKFFNTYGSATTKVYAWFSSCSVVSTTNGTAFTTHATVTPSGFTSSLFKVGVNYFGTKQFGFNQFTTHYTFGSYWWLWSSDLKKWYQNYVFRGQPVRTATYFIAVDDSSLQITRSTDGLAWSTTGVTQPSIPTGSGVKIRLFAVGGKVFLAASSNDQSSWSHRVTSNEGTTWQSISNASMFTGAMITSGIDGFWQSRKPISYFGGYFHAPLAWNDGSSQFSMRTMSQDGVTWSQPDAATTTNTGISYYNAFTVVAQNKLIIVTGASNSGSWHTYTSTDGLAFASAYYGASGADADRVDEIIQPWVLVNNSIYVSGQQIGSDEYVYISHVDALSSTYGVMGGSTLVFKNGTLIERLAGAGSAAGVYRCAPFAMIDDSTELVSPSYISVSRFNKTTRTFQAPAASPVTWDYVGTRNGKYMKVAD